MHNESAANHAIPSSQLNDLVNYGSGGGAFRVALDIPEITNVPDLVGRSSVAVIEWIEVSSSACASVPQITILVNVESPDGVRIISSDPILDSSRASAYGLLEGHISVHFGTIQNSYCFDSRGSGVGAQG